MNNEITEATLIDMKALLTKVVEGQKKHYSGEHISYGVFFNEWLQLKRLKLHPHTALKYEGLYRCHLQEPLENVNLTDINIPLLSALIQTEIDQGTATSTINDIFRCIVSQSLTYAEGKGDIEKNPMRFIKLPSIKQNHGRAMTDKEIGLMWSVARRDRIGIALPLLLGTGMRKGELLALEWSDIDFECAEITVNKAWVCIGGKGVLTDTKTVKSNRIIPIPANLVQMLRQYKEKECQGRRYVIGQTRSDKRIDPNNFDRSFNKWRNRAGVGKDIHIHCTRHTYITMMHELGIASEDLKGITGHADTRMIDRVYIHQRTDASQRKAVQQYDSVLSNVLSIPA